MAERRTQPAETPLSPPDVAFEQLQIELEGRRQPEDQTAFIDPSDVDTLTRTTRSDVDGGEQGEPPSTGDDLLESLDLLDSQGLRSAARVREALRADSSTAAYASQVQVIARAGVVVLRGVVDDLEDGEG